MVVKVYIDVLIGEEDAIIDEDGQKHQTALTQVQALALPLHVAADVKRRSSFLVLCILASPFDDPRSKPASPPFMTACAR